MRPFAVRAGVAEYATPAFMSRPKIIVGVDAALNSVGVAVLRVRRDGRIVACHTKSGKWDGGNGDARLLGLFTLVYRSLETEPDVFAVEDFARNARFRREEAGMSGGVVRLAWAMFQSKHGFKQPPVLLSPRQVKVFMCPNWPGWSKAHWERAVYTRKFKMSMPDKASVQSALLRRFKIKAANEHEADAASVALLAAQNHLGDIPLSVDSDSESTPQYPA